MALKNSSRIVYKGMDHVDIAMRFGDAQYQTEEINESKGNRETFYAMRAVIPNEDGTPNVIWKRMLEESDNFDHFVIPQLHSFWYGSQSYRYDVYLFYPKLKKFEKCSVLDTAEWNVGNEQSNDYYLMNGDTFWGRSGHVILATLNGFDYYKPNGPDDAGSYGRYVTPLADGILYFSWKSIAYGCYGYRFCYVPIVEKNRETGEIKYGEIEYYDDEYDTYYEYYGLNSGFGHFITEGNTGLCVTGNYLLIGGRILGENKRFIYVISRGPNISKINIGELEILRQFTYNGKAYFITMKCINNLPGDDYRTFVYQRITIDSDLKMSKEVIKKYKTYKTSVHPCSAISMINGVCYYDLTTRAVGVSYRHWEGIATSYLIIPCCNKNLKPIRVFFNYKYENVDNSDDYLLNLYFTPYDYNYGGKLSGYFSNNHICVDKPGVLMDASPSAQTAIYLIYIPLEDLKGLGTNNSYYFNGFIYNENDNKNIYTQYKEMGE